MDEKKILDEYLNLIDDFEIEMRDLSESGMMEDDKHIAMDKLMCDTLRSLGFETGVEIFESTHKWYA